MDAWDRFGSVYNWEAPRRFNRFFDIDFSTENKWKAAEASIRADWLLSLLTKTAAVAYALMCLLVCLFIVHATRIGESLLEGIKHPLLLVVGTLFVINLIWAIVAVRADDLCRNVNDVPRALWRGFLGAFALTPFCVMPSWAVSAILLPVMPLRLFAAIGVARYQDSLLLHGQFWRYGLAMAGAVYSRGGNGIEALARVATARRTDAFDIAAEVEKYRAIVMMIPILIVALLLSVVFDLRKETTMALTLIPFVALATYDSWRYSAIGMTWFPFLLRETEINPERNEPELPAISPARRLPFLLGPVGLAAFVTFFYWLLFR